MIWPHDERSIRDALKNFTVSSGFDRSAYIHVSVDDAVASAVIPRNELFSTEHDRES